MLIKQSASILLAIAALPPLTAMCQSTDYVIVQSTINPVMQPKSIVDAAQECSNDSICRTLADAVASYFGATPGSISAALASVPRAESKGEESWFTIQLPSGYQYCHSKIETISVVPASGDRASVMGASSMKDGIGIYTWTPRRGVGAGRSWVEAKYTLLGVRDDLADAARRDGTCKAFGAQLIDCRGATGVNKGMPACGVSQD
jgi:hypothetical protein